MFVSRETHDGPTEGNEPQISTRCHVTITTRSRPFITHLVSQSCAFCFDPRSPGSTVPVATRLFHRSGFPSSSGRRADGCPTECRVSASGTARAHTTNDARKAARARSTSFASQGKPSRPRAGLRAFGWTRISCVPSPNRPTRFRAFSVGRVNSSENRPSSSVSAPASTRSRLERPRATLASPTRGSRKCEETDPRDRGPRDVSRCRRGRRVPGPRHRARACRKTGPRYPARDRRGALRLEGVRGRAAGEAGFRGARD